LKLLPVPGKPRKEVKHFGNSRNCGGIIRYAIKLCKKGGRQKTFLLHKSAEMAGCDTNVQYVMHVMTKESERSEKPSEKVHGKGRSCDLTISRSGAQEVLRIL
jgi:hypothetical protein